MKRIKKFNESLSEPERFIYLLSSDLHRDSVVLNKGSLDIEGLKKLLIEEQKEYFGNIIIEETIEVEDKGSHGWLIFKYKDYDDDDDVEEGRCGFFKLKII